MDAQNVMDAWEVSPFDGGFDGIRDLQSRRFSGAVEAGGTWLFLRDGDPVAVVDDLDVDPRPGDVDTFEGASGQAHEATHPATATLAAMLALDGEVRGQYFTEDTPLSRVHETLSEGGFTGYVELSENVLSGDYYVVYEDGEEDHLGVLGSSQRLITDDEAQSKAEGEVGIYSVVAVSLPDVEIPAADTTTGGAGGAAGTGDPTGSAANADDETPDATAGNGSSRETDPGAPLDPDGDTAGEGGVAAGPGSEPEPRDGANPVQEPVADAENDREPVADAENDPEQETEADPAPESEHDPTPEPEPEDASPQPEPEDDADAGAAGDGEDGEGGEGGEGGIEIDPATEGDRAEGPQGGPGPDEGTGSAEGHESAVVDASTGRGHGRSSDPVLEGVTTRSVPSLDPERTGRAESSRPATAGQGAASGEPARRDTPTAPDPEPEPTTRDPEPEPETEPEPDPPEGRDRADGERLAAVREEYEARIESLESELASLREERDRLRERVSELQDGGGTAGGTGAAAGPALSPAEALTGTSLFVREGTRGEATLEDAHAGRTDRETLSKNLRIEYHTQFEDAGATVDGEAFEPWLRASAPYDFVEWLITDLLFEIQSTGASSALRPLYDAIPRIDRVGFDDPITVGEGEGEDAREVTFDVVARNQMGEPLVAATIDEGREPTQAESLRPLIGDAEDVALEHETLAATFSVTSSYFEPDALDAAREATSGSLLGREKYRSYVKLARKQGFHLCLVESREESFHLAVPEL